MNCCVQSETGLEDLAVSTIAPEILEEVEDCISRIMAYQKAQRRKVHRHVEPNPNGRAGLAALEALGVPIPDDFRALYWHYDGVSHRHLASPARAAAFCVFFNFFWSTTDRVLQLNAWLRETSPHHPPDMTALFDGLHGLRLGIWPQRAVGDTLPLVVKHGVYSAKSFIAFDSTLAMLRSVCAAQDAGILWHSEKFVSQFGIQGEQILPHQVCYNVRELWDVIRPFNPNADYWIAQFDGSIDWEHQPPRMTPEMWAEVPEALKKLVSRPREEVQREAEAEMRAAGVYDSDDPEAILDARDDALWREAAGKPKRNKRKPTKPKTDNPKDKS